MVIANRDLLPIKNRSLVSVNVNNGGVKEPA